MIKPNYRFEKHRKELKRKAKQDKKKRKHEQSNIKPDIDPASVTSSFEPNTAPAPEEPVP